MMTDADQPIVAGNLERHLFVRHGLCHAQSVPNSRSALAVLQSPQPGVVSSGQKAAHQILHVPFKPGFHVIPDPIGEHARGNVAFGIVEIHQGP